MPAISTKRALKDDIARGKYILNPNYVESEADKKEAREKFWEGPLANMTEFENTFPEDFGKKLPPEGKWVQIKHTPHTEFTVPPFSIWFALPWEDSAHSKNRVKIVTPSGSLGLWPHEYMVVEDMTQYLGRESEGILLHQMNDKPVCNVDHLFYLMSRGITRKQAVMMLINDIKDPTFLWLEFAPHYGEYFGKDWPSPDFCPFATPRDKWVAENCEETKDGWRMKTSA